MNVSRGYSTASMYIVLLVGLSFLDPSLVPVMSILGADSRQPHQARRCQSYPSTSRRSNLK